jgi:hypothetical protein
VASARPSVPGSANSEELIDFRRLLDDRIGVQTKALRAVVRRSRIGQRDHDPLLSAGRKKGGQHAGSCSLFQQQIHHYGNGKRHSGKPPADVVNRTGPSRHRAFDVTGQGEHCTEFNKEQARIFKAASPLAVTRITVA